MTSLVSAHLGRPLERWLNRERGRALRERNLTSQSGPVPKRRRPIEGTRWIERTLLGICTRLTAARGEPAPTPPRSRTNLVADHGAPTPLDVGAGIVTPSAADYPRFSGSRLSPGAPPWPAPDQLSTAARLAIREAIARLPLAHRAALVLGDVEGLSTERIAEVIGRPVQAARGLRHEARLAIMKALDEALACSKLQR